LSNPRPATVAWILAWTFVGILLIIVASVTVCATLLPGCSSCHMKGDFGTQTSASAHASVPCVQCHVQNDVVSRTYFGFSEMFHMVIPVVGPFGRFASAVPDATCLTCHVSVMGSTTLSNGLRINHRKCSVGAQCSDCHSTVAHGSQTTWPRTYAMDRCLHCHGGEGHVVKCDTCHRDRDVQTRVQSGQWSVTHGANWRKTHGMGDQYTCSACHPSGYCDRCHGVGLPHGQNFFAQHSTYGASPKAKCTMCHQTAFCVGCHGLPMPHPKGFLPDHANVVRLRSDTVCKTCHTQLDCDRCHTMHVHPGGANGVKNTTLGY
jgi:hypothetical protein